MLRTTFTIAFVTSLLAVAAGCSKKKPATIPVPDNEPPVAQPAPATPPPAAENTGNVSVSDDLVKQCKLKFDNLAEAPKFDLDRAELMPQDRAVLEQVAQCVTTGPLRGRTVQLTGRADPRGTDEYNMGLGQRRAETVGSYLIRLGVPSSQLSKSTRGEIDATGADEDGWRSDRRVDLRLGS